MTEFEKVSDGTDKRANYNSNCECAIEWIRGEKEATCTFPGNNRYNSKVRKLAEKFPDEVKIRHENADGSIVATIPVRFVKVSAPRVVSEEAKKLAAERMRNFRNNKA